MRNVTENNTPSSPWTPELQGEWTYSQKALELVCRQPHLTQRIA